MAHKDDPAAWPQVKFTFELSFDGAVQGLFQSASGIGEAAKAADVRVELTQGALTATSMVEAWMAAPTPRDVSVALRDNEGGVAMSWRLTKARPTKLEFVTAAGAPGDDRQVERLTLICAGLEPG